MEIRGLAIAATSLTLAGIATVAIGLLGERLPVAIAQMPTGTVCRVDGNFGVRCRDLEDELRQPPANEQTVVSISSYERFLDIGRSRFTGGDYIGAIAYYTQAIELNDSAPQAYSLRGTALLSSQQPHEAISDYTRALELSNGVREADAANFVGRAMSHSQVGQMHEAIVDASQAISINPDFAAAYLLRGNAQHQLEDTVAACQDWNQAANLYWKLEQFERYTNVTQSIQTARC
ncbi:MAG: tetratricopeptide repeat protein [Cyanobacteria bacterium P01_G01_bin.4]